MYNYAQLNKDYVCVGYKSILCKENDTNEYILLEEGTNFLDLMYKKYNADTKTFSEEKYYPVIEEIPNGMDTVKDKINALEIEKANLEKEVKAVQSAIDFILLNNGGI